MKTISIKLISYLSFAFIILLLIVVGIVGVTGKAKSNNDLQKMYVQSVVGISEMYSLTGLIRESYITLLEAQALDPRTRFTEEQIAQRRGEMEVRNNEIRAIWESINQLELTSEEKALTSSIEAQLSSYFSEGVEPATQLILNRDLITASNLLVNNIQTQYAELNGNVSQLTDYRIQFAANQRSRAIDRFEYFRAGLAITLVVATVLAIGISIYIARIINKPLDHIRSVLSGISDGNLNQSIQVFRKDELGSVCQGLSSMQQKLSDMITQIKTLSDQLNEASQELAVINNSSNETAEAQEERVEQAASAMTQLSEAVSSVASIAAQTATNSDDSEKLSTSGARQVEESANAIALVVEKIQLAASGSETLVGRVDRISTVLDVIDDISEQTNLLALNAAIEAARAGESGRGFAVVSEEVRSLAYRTSESLKEIEKLIDSAQKSSTEVISLIGDSVAESERAMEISSRSKEALLEIASLAEETRQGNLSIASSTEEQAQVTRHIDQNLSSIRDASNRAAKGARQSLDVSVQVSDISGHLDTMVAKFTT